VLPRLYAILDVDAAVARGHEPEQVAAAWLDAGVRLMQLRAKRLASNAFLELAERLAATCRTARCIFIVNDRVDVARLSGADGVHVGQDDLTATDVRRLLPAPAVLGLSTHNEGQLTEALSEPVDYVAVGPLFATATKARPDPAVGLDGVRMARRIVGPQGWPVVAIGGITLERAAAVIAAGATSVAVIGDLLEGDPSARARAFLRELGPAAEVI
jgi:thiamine-phosphate pyrophosphorylase